MKRLGQRIRELREARDLSLRELAKQLGISPPFMSDIELGRRYPSESVLKKMATMLDEPLGDLKKYDTRPPVEDLKRQAEVDPTFAMALRTVVDKKLTGEELLKLVRRARQNRPNKKE